MLIMTTDIEGYEGKYRVSEDGEVFSIHTRKGFRKLKGIVNTNGYRMVGFRDSEGKLKLSYIHRLVACAFIPRPEGFGVVNHIDHNKTNNKLNNLEWTNTAGNIYAYYEHRKQNARKS